MTPSPLFRRAVPARRRLHAGSGFASLRQPSLRRLEAECRRLRAFHFNADFVTYCRHFDEAAAYEGNFTSDDFKRRFQASPVGASF